MTRKSGQGPIGIDPDTGHPIMPVRQAFLKRGAPSLGRVKALDRLHLELANATEVYGSVADNGKRGAYMGLEAVGRFLDSQGIPMATFTPLLDLMLALAEAQYGIPNTLTAVEGKGKGRPQKGMRAATRDGLLAVIAELCWRHGQKQGWTLEQSMRKAAQFVNEGKRLGSTTYGAIKIIRDDVRQRPSTDTARMSFDTHLDSIVAKAIPLDVARMLSRHDTLVFAQPK